MSNPSTLGYLLIGKETTWGTPVTADKDCGLLITSVTPGFEREIVSTQGLSSIEVQKITSGTVGSKLSLTGSLQHARLFDYILGEASHALTGSDTKHTFTIDNAPVSMTGETGINASTDIVSKLDGLLCESAEVNVGLNKDLTISSNWLGAGLTNSASASSSVISTLPVFPQALCNVEVNGVAATEVQSATISINKVINRVAGTGSVDYQQGHATSIKFSFSATLGFSDKTYHDLLMGGTTPDGTPTAFDFEILCDNGVTLGSGRREFVLGLQNCMGSWDQAMEVEGIIFVEISGEGTFKECYSVDNIAAASWG